MIGYIYSIASNVSGRKYIGSTVELDKRKDRHWRELKAGKHHNVFLQRHADKYGIDDLSFEVILEVAIDTREQLNDVEQSFINENVNGFNLGAAGGGDLISNHPDRILIIERRSASQKNRLDSMPEEDKKLKWGQTGSDNGNWKGGISVKICPVCNATKIAPEYTTCSGCRDRSGSNNPFYGKVHSQETIEYLREVNSGDNSWIKGIDPALLPYTKWYRVSYTNGTIEEICGLKAIAEKYSCSIANVDATIKRLAKGIPPSKRSRFFGVTKIEVITK